MDMNQAIAALSALSQPTRLEIFRLLVTAGPDGLLPGEIATTLDLRQNTLSANLAILLQAHLASNQRQGRTIRYFADIAGIRAMLTYLVADCCGGRPDICAPLLELANCNC